MAETARAKADEKEFFDEEDILNKKVSQLAELITKSKHCVVFTGAGISTASGIKDFRSGINTKLETGAGVWALDAAKLDGIDTNDKEKNTKTTSMMSALPTLAHMAIVELMNKDRVKFCISQNVDGIHIKSGVPREKIAELHGNTTIEICEKCGAVYCRDFDVIRPCLHKTGRICSIKDCNGELVDTIVNFGDNLPQSELDAARENTQKGDLCISLGSSLTVSPACDLAGYFGEDEDKDLVIINLQSTPLDNIATLRLNGKIDDIIKLLFAKLEMKIPRWKLQRYVVLTIDDENNKLYVDGMDRDWKYPATIFKSVALKIGDTMQFKGDSTWIKEVKEEYVKTLNIDPEEAKKQEIAALTAALKGCDKSLSRYVQMIYNAGFHSVESLSEFRMDKAVEIMEGSNNYERRKIVETFSVPIVKDVNRLLENVEFKFNRDDLKNDEDEKDNTAKENYLEFEFAKHYNEDNVRIDLKELASIIKNGTENEHKYKYKFNLTFDFDKDEWTVSML